jgi:hypothetical protein
VAGCTVRRRALVEGRDTAIKLDGQSLNCAGQGTDIDRLASVFIGSGTVAVPEEGFLARVDRFLPVGSFPIVLGYLSQSSSACN